MKYSSRLAAGLAAIAVLTACDDKSPLEVTPQASIRFVNATGDVPGLNFTVNGTAATGAQNLAFGAATQCAEVPVGSATISSAIVGGGAFGNAVTQSLAADARFTVVATGTMDNPQYLVLPDASSNPTAGNAQLRIVNAFPSSTAADIFVTAPDAELGTATATNIGFNAGTQFVNVPAGAVQVRFTDTGTSNVTFTGTPFTLQAGQTQTVIIAPGTDPGTFRTITVSPCS